MVEVSYAEIISSPTRVLSLISSMGPHIPSSTSVCHSQRLLDEFSPTDWITSQDFIPQAVRGEVCFPTGPVFIGTFSSNVQFPLAFPFRDYSFDLTFSSRVCNLFLQLSPGFVDRIDRLFRWLSPTEFQLFKDFFASSLYHLCFSSRIMHHYIASSKRSVSILFWNITHKK